MVTGNYDLFIQLYHARDRVRLTPVYPTLAALHAISGTRLNNDLGRAIRAEMSVRHRLTS